MKNYEFYNRETLQCIKAVTTEEERVRAEKELSDLFLKKLEREQAERDKADALRYAAEEMKRQQEEEAERVRKEPAAYSNPDAHFRDDQDNFDQEADNRRFFRTRSYNYQ